MDFGKVVESISELPTHKIDAFVVIARNALKYSLDQYGSQPGVRPSALRPLTHFLNSAGESAGVGRRFTFSLSEGTFRNGAKNIEEEINSISNERLARKVFDEQFFTTSNGKQIVNVSSGGIVKLHGLLNELRQTLKDSNLDDERKKRALEKLDEFERELVTKSVSYSKTLAILASVGATIAVATSTFADAPAALKTLGEITSHLGLEKQQQDEVQSLVEQKDSLRLTAPENETSKQD